MGVMMLGIEKERGKNTLFYNDLVANVTVLPLKKSFEDVNNTKIYYVQ